VSDTSTPKGVVAILADQTGNVVGTAANFDPSGYGGFSVYESQRERAGNELAQKFLRDYCGEDIAVVLATRAVQIVRDLCQKRGFKLTLVKVGYDGD
jgi:hypothetical protein